MYGFTRVFFVFFSFCALVAQGSPSFVVQPGSAKFSDAESATTPAARAANGTLAHALSAVEVTADGKISSMDLTQEDLSRYTSGTSAASEASEGDARESAMFADSVFGRYERTQVTDTQESPYRYIGRIAIGCTGTLIGPRHVLTAGHCVYDIDNNEWYKKLTFTPAQNGSRKPFGSVGWEKVYVVKGWTEDHDTNYDYALIVLKEPVGQKLGWMSFGYNAEGLPNEDLHIVGFPGDKPEGTMWEVSCPVMGTTKDQVKYQCDTYGGNSGSSVWMNDGRSRTIYVVHTNGGPSFNRGTRISSSVFTHLTDWKEMN